MSCQLSRMSFQKMKRRSDDKTIITAVFRSGYQVRTTTDCQEALRILQAEQVNTIISDQRMPEMRGVDLLYQARKISPNTMRLLLTGYSDIPSILDAINQSG